jgi:hypothetical protein
MALAFQVLGFLVAGGILAYVLAEGSLRIERFLLAGVGLAIALVASVLFWDHVWQIGSGLPESTRTASEVSSFAAQHAADPGANNAFLAWARREMLTVARDRGTYYLEPTMVLKEPQLGQWSTYELLPERATSKLSEADWIVFYGATSNTRAERRRQFGPIMQFSPGYALARRISAR